jgi:hypothetical protein
MASELNAAVASRTKGHVIAEFCAAAGGSLDADIGQHPYHDDLFDAALLELESATGIDGCPPENSVSQEIRRWREMDSNSRFRARRNLGIPL